MYFINMANKYYHFEYLVSIYTYHTCVFYRSIFLGHSLQKYNSIVSPSALVLLYDEVQSLHMHVVFQQQHWVSELKNILLVHTLKKFWCSDHQQKKIPWNWFISFEEFLHQWQLVTNNLNVILSEWIKNTFFREINI